jgi:ribosomal-protein-alanine N-acetyltransferase
MPLQTAPLLCVPPRSRGVLPATDVSMSRTRLVTIDDAKDLAQLLRANRAFLAPWEPLRNESYFTEDGQRTTVSEALAAYDRGVMLPHVIVDDDAQVVGRVTLNGIVRGPLLSCSIGYWVSADANGRGFATAAVRAVKDVAFGELGLHRIQAESLADNAASQGVLKRNGFVQYGLAPQYLKIAGRWQDHLLYQVLNPVSG